MLKVLNINNFIKTHKLQEVTNRQSFTKEGKPTTDGLYSETIFGITSDEISTNFAYINLSTWIIHPAILGSLTKVSTLFKKVIYGDKKAVIENGQLVESEDGSTGVGFLFNSWAKIDFMKYQTEKNKQVVTYFDKIQRDEVFINKYLVIPPKFRMYTQKHGITIEDETTMFYKRLLGLTVIGQADSSLMQAILKNSNKDLEIQKAVIVLYEFFLEKLEKKEGQFRSSLISKRIDNNVRLVANARPDIPFNCAGLPWHVLLNIFDAFIVGSLNKKIFSEDYGKMLGVEQFSSSKFGTHFDYIFRNVDTYTEANPGKREIWVKLLKEMFDYHPDLKVLLKRDPSWNKDSYHALFPIIIPTNSFHIVVNSLLYKPLGGDSFNTNFTTGIKDNIICQDDNGYISTRNETSYYIRSLNYLFDNLESNL